MPNAAILLLQPTHPAIYVRIYLWLKRKNGLFCSIAQYCQIFYIIAKNLFLTMKTTRLHYLIAQLLLAYCFFASCSPSTQEATEKNTDSTLPLKAGKSAFGTTKDGLEVSLFTLVNTNGMRVRLTNYGATLVSVEVPDRNGLIEDVTLGFDNILSYQDSSDYFGSIVGRFGNRIANGSFTLDGNTYQLAKNNNGQHLHGGIKGFDKVVWEAVAFGDNRVTFFYESPDGEEGYPGTLRTNVTYQLTDDNALHIEYEATTDQKTVVNLTNHVYFNLTGYAKRDILDHELQLNCRYFIPVNEVLIPTGEVKAVEGTAFDFTQPKPIGRDIAQLDSQLVLGRGYDHSFVIDGFEGELPLAARVYEPESGRVLEVFTREPAVQLYTGNFLTGRVRGRNGVVYKHRYGFCLETQHYPDSPNQPHFPPVVLAPGDVYQTKTVYRFSTASAQ